MLLMLAVSCNKIVTPDESIDKKDAEKEIDSSETKGYSIDYLILVDKNHPIPKDWEEGLLLMYTDNSVGDDVYVEKTAFESYQKLKKDLEDEGIHIELDSAFRSIAAQQKIVDDFTERYGPDYAHTYAATPGFSEHHTGLALDLYLIVDGKTVYENEDLIKYPEVWEKIHAKLAEYGFILRYPGGGEYPYEPWHIRYVGIEAARAIKENNIMLEDYLEENN